MREKIARKGFLMNELIVALTVMAMLLVAFALSLDGFRRFNHFHLVKQRCLSAAQATLDSISAAAPIIQEDVNQLWPGICIEVNKTPGQGQWKEMTLITVTAHGQALNKKVTVSLSRYFAREFGGGATGRKLAFGEQ